MMRNTDRPHVVVHEGKIKMYVGGQWMGVTLEVAKQFAYALANAITQMEQNEKSS